MQNATATLDSPHPPAISATARRIARSILTGFDRHFSVFQQISNAARQRFESGAWESMRTASARRMRFYDQRVNETIDKVRAGFDIGVLDEALWQQVKRAYEELLTWHSRAELAETFYNSVFCRLFHRRYYNNGNIFLESGVDRGALAAGYRAFMSFHPGDGELKDCIWEILSAFYFSLSYEDLERDAERIAAAWSAGSGMTGTPRGDLRFDILESPFYRNKAAYLIGRAVRGSRVRPFLIPLIRNPTDHDRPASIRADALLTAPEDAEAVFSFARAYFMASTPVPAATVDFLSSIMPEKPCAELYMSIGFHKQAKNEFYRDFLHHLRDSDDIFEAAPGTRGLVMVVFTLPSYPYVFKVIRDRFPAQKEVTRDLVKKRYLQVKLHDRVGRMADTLEFSDVAFPLDRFSPALLRELRDQVPSQLEIEGDQLLLRHLYIEKRMMPLNLFLEDAGEQETRGALHDWGMAVKQLMAVNIFPGDLLFKNFGVSCQGKVVFYDYDEIRYLEECNFRRIPPAMNPEDEMSAEPWYTAGANDVFPEEFPLFLCSDPARRRLLRELHPDLFDYRFWQQRQRDVKAGVFFDLFPYDPDRRFPP